MDDDLRGTVNRHTEEIMQLQEGYDRHNHFLFGRYDEQSNSVIPGFATRLATAIDDIGEIKKSIGTFTAWAQTSLTRAIVAGICFVFSALGSALWFIVTHFDKIEKAFK